MTGKALAKAPRKPAFRLAAGIAGLILSALFVLRVIFAFSGLLVSLSFSALHTIPPVTQIPPGVEELSPEPVAAVTEPAPPATPAPITPAPPPPAALPVVVVEPVAPPSAAVTTEPAAAAQDIEIVIPEIEEFAADEFPEVEFAAMPPLAELPPVAIEGETVKNADGSLVSFFADEDSFFVLSAFGPNSEKAEALNTVSGGELRFTRSKYDRFLRKTSQTVWQKTGENREQISRTIYRYAGEAAKTAEKQTVYSFANKTVEETFYNSEGNKTLVRLSRTGEDEDGKATVTPVTETRYEYDGAGSMTAMTVKPLESPVDGQGVSEETTRYRESEFSKSKDTEIYRDEKLVKSVLYGAEETRTETRFITADYSVETVYKNNTLVSERYFFKGKEIRRRDYDETH